MRLNNQELHNALTEKGIRYLYHANTVATSITFLEYNGLMSRGAIEEKELHQTDQSSDELDKVFNVWNDIFLDTVDLHGYFPRQNLYGPVLFEFDVDLVLNEDYEIWITKNNPIYWETDYTDEDKYFSNVQDLLDNWDNIERQRKMITIRSNRNAILFDNLNKVLVDDPRVIIYKDKNDEIHLFNSTKRAIKEVIEDKIELRNKFKTRICNSCFCRENYLNVVTSTNLKRLFLPK